MVTPGRSSPFENSFASQLALARPLRLAKIPQLYGILNLVGTALNRRQKLSEKVQNTTTLHLSLRALRAKQTESTKPLLNTECTVPPCQHRGRFQSLASHCSEGSEGELRA